MKHKLKVSVDCGQIIAMVTALPGSDQNIPLSKGKYKITLSVKDCWNGSVKNHGYLDVKKDSFLSVADGFLDESGEEDTSIDNEDLHKKGCSVSTGGDGDFAVVITLTKVKKIGTDPYKVLLNKAKKFFKTRKYSEDNAKKFVDKFMGDCYYESINKILWDARLKDLKKMTKSMDKILAKLDKESKNGN